KLSEIDERDAQQRGVVGRFERLFHVECRIAVGKHGTSGHQYLDPGLDRRANGFERHATIDLDTEMQTLGGAKSRYFPDFSRRRGQKFLSAETRVEGKN